jgi:hypothetical protein
MRKPLLPGLLLLNLASVAIAQPREPVVNHVSDLAARLSAFGKVAIAPIEPCPAVLACAEVEKKLFSAFFERRARSPWKPAVVSAESVRQKMFELGIRDVSGQEERRKLAQALGVDILLVPAVPYVGSKLEPKTLFTPAGNAPEVRVDLTVYAANSEPELLFRGTNQALATTYSRPEGLATTLFKKLLARLLPAE